jgi:hypothetical protein
MASVHNMRIYIDYCFSKIKTMIIQNRDYKKYKRYEKPFLPWNLIPFKLKISWAVYFAFLFSSTATA